jgi:hypothetical protein
VRCPATRVTLPVGRAFDVVDVPVTDGVGVLYVAASLRVILGPVCTEDRRMLFFVRPGSVGPLAGQAPLRDGQGRDLDVRYRLSGDHLIAPPLATRDEPGSRWIHPPASHPPELPHAADIVRVVVSASHLRHADPLPHRRPAKGRTVVGPS